MAHDFHYEFGGPAGAVGTMLGLPFAILALASLCNAEYCIKASNFAEILDHVPTAAQLYNVEAIYVFLGWFGFQVVLERILPGKDVQGNVLSDGTRLTYRLSGHLQFWVSLAVVLALHHYTDIGFDLTWVYFNYVQLATASIIFSAILSVVVYAMSFAPGIMLAEGGDSGNPVYDFFIGRALNPRIGSLDLKQFCELRPGLIGWAVINLAMVHQEYATKGFVSTPMILVNLFQALYVWDALFQEQAILSTMDITTDGFGYMLVFGDLAWVPFTYGIQAHYLVDHTPAISSIALAAIVCVNIFGFMVFRGSNGQKDQFRRDPTHPSVAHLRTMETRRGRKLLISGWWGMARKINYTGDWIMGLSWCAYCGFDDIIPFWYCIYFAGLLAHRAWRDDEMCAKKYGGDWAKYKKEVPSVFFPGII